MYGSFDENPAFWDSITPIAHVKDIEGPIQLHHGTNDDEVPLLFSERLDEALKSAGKIDELYVYDGDDHNISNNLNLALSRSVAFFDQYVKGINE
jgi:dipeptidyl aminopeptidase/acylaminoacyl peptidase